MTTPGEVKGVDGKPTHIGRYRIIERIGRGAMGVVYAVEDEAIGRKAAVKVMTADLEVEPDIRERFYREAKVTGQLAHRNIVTVFDLGEDGARPFIVMELLKGQPLPEYLRSSTLSLDARIDLMMQLCEGLQVAHTRGVIHRDIKPNNLFVLPDGTLKILDFGVAHLASSNLTGTGLIVGTLEYMSPEQALGRHIDARSDVFAAACVAYFILAGRSPFAASDLRQIMLAVVNETPLPLTEEEAPARLARVLMKALSKTPDDRYQQAAEMLMELDHVRRAYAGVTHRIAKASLDRYRQILATIEERRVLGRSVGIPEIDVSCNDAIGRLAARFPQFARHADDRNALLEPMDRDDADHALVALQTRHNAELALLAALKTEMADAMKVVPAVDLADLMYQGTGGQSEAGVSARTEAGERSLQGRMAAIWRRLTSRAEDV